MRSGSSISRRVAIDRKEASLAEFAQKTNINSIRRDVACNVSAGGTGAAGETQQAASLRVFLDYFFVHWSTQSFTVLYQSREFCGFSTQWPSSGK